MMHYDLHSRTLWNIYGFRKHHSKVDRKDEKWKFRITHTNKEVVYRRNKIINNKLNDLPPSIISSPFSLQFLRFSLCFSLRFINVMLIFFFISFLVFFIWEKNDKWLVVRNWNIYLLRERERKREFNLYHL